MRGGWLYNSLYEIHDDEAELYRRLAFDLERFWNGNNKRLLLLTRAYEI